MQALTSWHSYPSIYNMGHRALQDLLTEPVYIQEKIDGSQFSFGRYNGELRCRSKGAQLNVIAPEKMFQKAVDIVSSLDLIDGWTYRGEYLSSPKHNTLVYERTPKNHVILFDINIGEEGYLNPPSLLIEADRLGLETVPLLYVGMLTDVTVLRELLDLTSILGGQKVEGVVIKSMSLFGPDKKRLMGKFVSEAFKEVHAKDWKERNPGGQDLVQLLGQQYRTPARWAKAMQHLRDAGQLTDSPRDIGPLLKEINDDVRKECEEEIRNALFKWAWPKISRAITAGAPEWYKEQLLALQFEEVA